MGCFDNKTRPAYISWLVIELSAHHISRIIGLTFTACLVQVIITHLVHVMVPILTGQHDLFGVGGNAAPHTQFH